MKGNSMKKKILKSINTIPSLRETIARHSKPIFIIGILPSALAFSLFSQSQFFEFIKHHISYLNYGPFFIISLLIYIIGLIHAYCTQKQYIESEFKALFQSIIGILLFLFVIGFVNIFKEPKYLAFYTFLSLLSIFKCYLLFIPLRLIDKYEIELLIKNNKDFS